MQSTTVISIVGCGGKSTLLKHLATTLPYKKTLVTTSTKMYKSQLDFANFINPTTFELPGIYALYNSLDAEKCSSIEYESLLQTYKLFDLVIIEADGCKCLPIKLSNREKEPVIYDFTTHTIGVINLNYLDTSINNSNTFNYKLTNETTYSKQAIDNFINNPNGLFKNSYKEKIICYIKDNTYEFKLDKQCNSTYELLNLLRIKKN